MFTLLTAFLGARKDRAISSSDAATAIRIVVAVLALAMPAVSQQPRPAASAPRDSLNSIQAKLRSEAAKVERLEVSPLFAAITGPTADLELRLRDEQIQLCRKFELLARDMVRGWLLRDLDSDPPPETSRLEARLGDQSVKLRKGAASLPLVAQIAENPEAIDLLRAMDPVVNNTRDQADAAILSVLSPLQIRTMKRLLTPVVEPKLGKPNVKK